MDALCGPSWTNSTWIWNTFWAHCRLQCHQGLHRLCLSVSCWTSWQQLAKQTTRHGCAAASWLLNTPIDFFRPSTVASWRNSNWLTTRRMRPRPMRIFPIQLRWLWSRRIAACCWYDSAKVAGAVAIQKFLRKIRISLPWPIHSCLNIQMKRNSRSFHREMKV